MNENIKVIITGSTGMVGKGALLVCLDDPRVEQILVINRSSVGIEHSKLKEILHQDFMNLDSIEDQLSGYDAVFFCLGVSAGGMTEEAYRRVTYDYTTLFARTALEKNVDLSFIYVSGAGTDSSEKGRAMWARVKGATENALLAMNFKQAYMFRPGAIQPMRGVRTRTKAYRLILNIISPLWPLIRLIFGDRLTDTDRIGNAMINLTLKESAERYFQNRGINQLSDLK